MCIEWLNVCSFGSCLLSFDVKLQMSSPIFTEKRHQYLFLCSDQFLYVDETNLFDIYKLTDYTFHFTYKLSCPLNSIDFIFEIGLSHDENELDICMRMMERKLSDIFSIL